MLTPALPRGGDQPAVHGWQADERAMVKGFCADEYSATSKTDLFAMFIDRGLAQWLQPGAYSALITMQSWMFLSAYESCGGARLIESDCHHAHLGARAFRRHWRRSGADGGLRVRAMRPSPGLPAAISGSDFRALRRTSTTGLLEAVSSQGEDLVRPYPARDFTKHPGQVDCLLAVSLRLFEQSCDCQHRGRSLTAARAWQLATMTRFVRCWHEVAAVRIGFGCTIAGCGRWSEQDGFPTTRAGTSDGGRAIMSSWLTGSAMAVIRAIVTYRPHGNSFDSNQEYILRRDHGCWSKVTLDVPAFAIFPAGFIF